MWNTISCVLRVWRQHKTPESNNVTNNLPKIAFNEEVEAATYLQSELLFHVWKKHLEKQDH